jgi:hypothetical protein
MTEPGTAFTAVGVRSGDADELMRSAISPVIEVPSRVTVIRPNRAAVAAASVIPRTRMGFAVHLPKQSDECREPEDLSITTTAACATMMIFLTIKVKILGRGITRCPMNSGAPRHRTHQPCRVAAEAGQPAAPTRPAAVRV